MSAAIAGMVSSEVGRWRRRILDLEGRQLAKQTQVEDLTAQHGRLIAEGDDDGDARKVGALARAVEAELADITHGLAAAAEALAAAERDAATKAKQIVVDEIDRIMRERAGIAAKCDREMRSLSRHFEAMGVLAARAEGLRGHPVNRQDHPLNVSAVVNRATLFSGAIGLDHWLRGLPERGQVAEWPKSFAAGELGAQKRYLEGG